MSRFTERADRYGRHVRRHSGMHLDVAVRQKLVPGGQADVAHAAGGRRILPLKQRRRARRPLSDADAATAIQDPEALKAAHRKLKGRFVVDLQYTEVPYVVRTWKALHSVAITHLGALAQPVQAPTVWQGRPFFSILRDLFRWEPRMTV